MKSANLILRVLLTAMLFLDAFRVVPLLSSPSHYEGHGGVQQETAPVVYAGDNCVVDADCNDGIACTSNTCDPSGLCIVQSACAPGETCTDSNNDSIPECS